MLCLTVVLHLVFDSCFTSVFDSCFTCCALDLDYTPGTKYIGGI